MFVALLLKKDTDFVEKRLPQTSEPPRCRAAKIFNDAIIIHPKYFTPLNECFGQRIEAHSFFIAHSGLSFGKTYLIFH